jgi:hypothetical protein
MTPKGSAVGIVAVFMYIERKPHLIAAELARRVPIDCLRFNNWLIRLRVPINATLSESKHGS